MVTSSGLGERPIAGCATYSAANASSNFMAQALSYELKEQNIHVMSWVAGAAATKMFHPDKRAKMRPVGPCVDAMLADLSNGELISYGSRQQHQMNAIFGSMPNFAVNRMMFKAMCKSYHDDMERMKKEGSSMDEYL